MKKSVIVYDGSCSFCLAQIGRIKRWDKAEQFEYLSKQDATTSERFPILEQGNFATGMRVLTAPDEIFIAADAVYQIAKRLSPHRYVAWLYRVPVLRSIFKLLYSWVAKNRSRFSKQAESKSYKTDS